MSKQTVKTRCNPPLTPEMNFESAEWRDGYLDGRLQTWASSPDMRRGMQYALGWITARFCKEPPSLSKH